MQPPIAKCLPTQMGWILVNLEGDSAVHGPCWFNNLEVHRMSQYVYTLFPFVQCIPQVLQSVVARAPSTT